MKQYDELPAVDESALLKILGADAFPEGFRLDHRERIAARVLTDALARKLAPGVAMTNAVAWIKDAYRDGHEAGVRAERARWEQKIASVFGLGGK